jgi:hypothetical protein
MKNLWSETIGPILFAIVLFGVPIYLLVNGIRWIKKNNKKNAIANNQPPPQKETLIGMLFRGVLKWIFLGSLFGSNDNDSSSSISESDDF